MGAALRLFGLACDDGLASGCYELGMMLHFAVGIVRDVPRAAILYGAACNAGHAAACTRIGYLHGMGLGVRKDSVAAFSCSSAHAIWAASPARLPPTRTVAR